MTKPGTISLVFTGRWQKHWYEFFPDTKLWIKYGWGRIKISKSKKLPKNY